MQVGKSTSRQGGAYRPLCTRMKGSKNTTKEEGYLKLKRTKMIKWTKIV